MNISLSKEKLQEIRTLIREDGRTVRSWARIRNFSFPTVHAILRGHYNLESNTAQRVFEQLRHDGYLQDERQAANIGQ